MATVSTPNLAYPSNLTQSPSPPIKGLKKVLSNRRRSSEVQSESGTPARRSIESLNLDRSPVSRSPRTSPSRDGSSKAGSGGVHRLIPGHHKRQRQRIHEAELKVIDQEPISRGRTPELATPPPPGVTVANRSTSSLLTEGSENDTPPPLVSRNSHTGYFTTSSPLISSKTIVQHQKQSASTTSLPATTPVESFPIILEPGKDREGNVSPKSPKSPKLDLASTPSLSSVTLSDRADTLRVEPISERRGSISRLRGKSPARKIRDVFSRSARSPRSSPEREIPRPASINDPTFVDQVSLAERRLGEVPGKTIPAPLQDSRAASQPANATPTKVLELETDMSVPRTPPSARLSTPLTTVTPPTPTDFSRAEVVTSPRLSSSMTDQDSRGTEKQADTAESMSTHRRTGSNSTNATHQRSKLSTSMIPPLTPTIEDANKGHAEKSTGGRSFTPNSGFFSSWVSAAQNAATSITNLTGPNRSRAGTSNTDPGKTSTIEELEEKETDSNENVVAKKQLAVETLGSGNLDFSHLGLDSSAEDKASISSRPDLSSLRKKSDLQRDEAQAKVEDILAQRAVSAAYQDAGESTPVAEISDPVANITQVQTFDASGTGSLTPSNGSVFENDNIVKRSSSVRSKIANRRSRGSSITTGQSGLGTTITGSTATLVHTPTGPRATGFTPAPRQRNRGFHQQFRSVPEDDNLIEDYSCALQKEILLAGRIYISEGHICFSSNILGWVTTLIISFEEIVSIERENTAMIIPNAIAIQTLHARHTFRSLLSREATFDLMIGIWKVNHPASFFKSVNGKQLAAEQAQHDAEKALTTKPVEEAESEGSSSGGSGSDNDDDERSEGSAPSIMGSSGSIAGSEFLEAKSITRKPSGTNGASTAAPAAAPAGGAGEVAATAAVVAGVPGAAVDFPGPVTHGPTECNDSATHYDKVIKDEVIPAPLGKIYSLIYGPQSGVFMRKFLVDECKSLDLALEDDKKGLTNESPTRQYSYIKPLGGSIGPKQTKCNTTENLDFFDLEKAVTVTCTTTTPDVPSGGAFSTKTRYCLTWAPGNATRFQMNMTIEWTAKSWLKGPIEKGANDGQQQYGDSIVKALKGALGRSRGGTVGSKGAKPKKRKKGEKKSRSEQAEQTRPQVKDWGLFEPVRPALEPVVDIIKPAAKMELVVGLLCIVTIILWFGGSRGGNRQLGYLGSAADRPERLAAYEQLWQREESELWDWLQNRAGVDHILLGRNAEGATTGRGKTDAGKKRQKVLKDKGMAARLQAEKWSRKEMQEAVRVTRERLEEMQRALDGKVV